MPESSGTGLNHPLWDRLRATLADLAASGPLGIAFSGGLDSRFLAHAAQRFGIVPTLLHVTGPHIAPDESAWARLWARSRGLTLLELALDPLVNPAVAANTKDRCYHCKHLLFSAMLKRLEPDSILCDGSNTSDQSGYRPGLRAVRELGIRSPLAGAGLSKAHIHELAALTGLDRPDQRPRPCLLTRLAYGLRPTPELLARLAEAERAVTILLQSEAGPVAAPIAALIKEDAVPDFRLRLPRPGVLELHCACDLPLPQQERIRDAVAALGLPRPDFVHLPTLSGYFDAQKQTDTARGSS